MKKSFGAMMLMVALAGMLVVGCKKDDGTGPSDQAPAGVSNELQAMTYYSSNDAFVVNDEQTIADQNVRSHTFHFVTPGDTDTLKIPNACNLCHTDKSTEWAKAALESWPDRSPWRMSR